MPALAVDDVGEQEGLAVLLFDAAAELPAHQRVHFGIFVDRPIDLDQQSRLVQRADVIVQVGIGPAQAWGGVRFGLVLASMALPFWAISFSVSQLPPILLHGAIYSALARRRQREFEA